MSEDNGRYTGPDLRRVLFTPAPELRPGQRRLRYIDEREMTQEQQDFIDAIRLYLHKPAQPMN